MSSGPDDREDLRDIARERVDEMPAETALGRRDPLGGGEGDPKDYPGDGNGPGPAGED